MDRLDGGKFQRLGGAAGARSAHNAGGGGPWPPPLRWFCGPFGPAKRRRPPGVTQRRPPTPTPARFRRPPGGCSWEAGRKARTRGGRRRLAAGGRPQGRPPACQTKSAGRRQSLRPRAFQDASRPAAAPPLGVPLTPKRQHKSQAFRPTRPRPVHRPEKGGSDREPLRGRLQLSRRAERGFFRGHGAGAVCSGFAAMLPPGAAEEGARSRCLRRPTTTMPGGSRAVKTGRTRPCPMPHWSRDGMSEAPVKELYRGPGCRKTPRGFGGRSPRRL